MSSNRHLCNNLFWSFILLIQMKIPLFYAVRVVLVFIFWYQNNVFSSSTSGRTRKYLVSNSFPVSCLCSQKRYQLDEILLLMDGSSGMMCGIVSFIMQPSFCIQEWRETTQQTLGKRKFSCSSFRFSRKCINHILYIHLFIYYIFIYYLYI